jgi:hypothetical protein
MDGEEKTNYWLTSVRRNLSLVQELSHGQPNVFGDPSQKDRGDVTALVKRDWGAPSVCMFELLVPTLLPNLKEPHCFKNGNQSRGLEDWDVTHD